MSFRRNLESAFDLYPFVTVGSTLCNQRIDILYVSLNKYCLCLAPYPCGNINCLSEEIAYVKAYAAPVVKPDLM